LSVSLTDCLFLIKFRQKSYISKAKETVETEQEQTGLLAEERRENGDGDIELTDTQKTSSPMIEINEKEQELQALLDKESETPTDKVVIMSVMVLVVIVLNLLKGGSSKFPNPLHVVCGSTTYWMLTAAVLVWVLAISVYMRQELIKKYYLKKKLGYKYLPGDVEWNERNTIVYPCIVFFAGFFAGLFGVGGGIIKGPLMLEMGVHPLVAR
jgi:hypothetical protein